MTVQSQPFRLDDVHLLTHDGGTPLEVEDITLTFDDEGVGVVRAPDEPPRVLPWTSLVTHAVEPWAGGVLPEWWIDPELAPRDQRSDVGTAPPSPETGPGALISLKTASTTYRFLVPDGDAGLLAPHIAALAYSHLGPAGTPSTTTVDPRVVTGAELQPAREPVRTWLRVRPFLTAVLILVLVTGAVLIVLQSAGVVHLPYLGGNAGGQ